MKKKHPQNKYVRDLGAASPPAFPEKELAEMRGFGQGKVVIWVVTIIVGLCLIFRPEVDRAFDRLLGLDAKQPEISVTVWLNETRLDNTCPTHDDCDEQPVHFVSNGDEIRILAEGRAEVDKIVYYFPTVSLESYSIEGGEGSFILQALPTAVLTDMWIEVHDTAGNMQMAEYTFFCQ